MKSFGLIGVKNGVRHRLFQIRYADEHGKGISIDFGEYSDFDELIKDGEMPGKKKRRKKSWDDSVSETELNE